LDGLQFLRTDLQDNEELLAQAIPVPLNQGDLLLFHSNLFHAAGRNTTGNAKYSLVFTYRGADNPPKEGTRSSSVPDIVLAENN
jgi:phytanoyl-CoA hydroxylase